MSISYANESWAQQLNTTLRLTNWWETLWLTKDGKFFFWWQAQAISIIPKSRRLFLVQLNYQSSTAGTECKHLLTHHDLRHGSMNITFCMINTSSQTSFKYCHVHFRDSNEMSESSLSHSDGLVDINHLMSIFKQDFVFQKRFSLPLTERTTNNDGLITLLKICCCDHACNL